LGVAFGGGILLATMVGRSKTSKSEPRGFSTDAASQDFLRANGIVGFQDTVSGRREMAGDQVTNGFEIIDDENGFGLGRPGTERGQWGDGRHRVHGPRIEDPADARNWFEVASRMRRNSYPA